jgi:uncharacterized protein YndB with AHSA1/START domain
MNDGPAVLRIERTFDAPVGEVFEAWTSTEVLRRWWHAEHDWETPRAEVDLRVGGAIEVSMRNPRDGTEYTGSGEFTEIRPPERLAFTWSWDDPADSGSQLIEVDFVDRGETTTVVLTHSGLEDEEARESFRDGWRKSFDNLDRALAA